MNTGRKKIIEEFFDAVGHMQRMMLAHKDRIGMQLGLNKPQLEALFYISKNSPTIKDLSMRMHVTSSASTQLIEGLVKLGYVKREEDVSDRRIVRVILTEDGRMHIKEFKEKIILHVTPRLAHLSDNEIKTFSEIVKKIAEGKE